MKTNVLQDFHICISVPLMSPAQPKNYLDYKDWIVEESENQNDNFSIKR